MNYRNLGNSGLKVSEIGFGAWGIGGNAEGAIAYGHTDDNESRRALHRAFDKGITFFDTSNLYGLGHSEKLIGEALHGVRDEIVIASKTGFVSLDGQQDFSTSSLTRSLEESLTRLRTDRIDLFHLHNPTVELLRSGKEIFPTLEKLRSQGKIRFIGISLCSPDDGSEIANSFFVHALQVNLSMIDQRALNNGLLDQCHEKNIGVIARTPLCFGFLSGRIPAQNVFPPDDHRSRWSSEQRKIWADAWQVFSKKLTVACGQTPAQMALRFCLSFPAVSAVIPGMLTVAEVNENAHASSFGPLSDEELEIIRKVYQKSFKHAH